MNKEEKKIIKRIEDTFNSNTEKVTLYEEGIADILKLLNFTEKQQKKLKQKESILDKVTDKLKEVGNKYIKEYKDVEKLDLIQQNTAVLQELSCVIDDIEDILKLIEGEKK